MAPPQVSQSDIDLEQGDHRRSVSGSELSADCSVYFSDADEGSCYSQFYSTNGGSYDEYRFAFVSQPGVGVVVSDSRRLSSASDRSVEVENENGITEIKVHLGKVERDCRICHLGLESNSQESGIPIELGCSCKDDLAAAHKHCAETWFKIKGNKTCEICHSVARNILGPNEVESTEQSNESNNASSTTAVAASIPSSDSPSFWRGHRFLNFLLACMVFAFVISWLFHFNVPS
ncbi:uncharacterized protein LOC111799566 [Cucurbita pepo subsp. pepo]|uniref:uncharacterized protein LOC111799566 n=1 Tax=Cucurbita pepo subsp. pepo TaxID=3664 RepID=UPI000C9DA5AB|nr:uncharacterized protein LOC111799566 [Cucurbita pepo subsp. pepo]